MPENARQAQLIRFAEGHVLLSDQLVDFPEQRLAVFPRNEVSVRPDNYNGRAGNSGLQKKPTIFNTVLIIN